MSEKDTKQISKFLSYVLRHKPEAIGLTLDANGWADVTVLLEKMHKHGTKIDMELLNHVVDTNSKKRFSFNDAKDRIRASQGHSLEIELGYEPLAPPEILYHGTAGHNVEAILKEGIRKGNRHHVHLSLDKATATNVGGRHGKPVILEVLALQMHNDGYEFFLSENGVWLTDGVPAGYIK
ncbi:RNA 2'-phosphotransferase [Flavobacterium sp. MFBS3-15]|uniref:RNA 2'-phosphotransferase n=1 Tax=Flavobacterium sp. MFBS3-15 TaxID=2989816 RepID=UPI002235E4BF|nr:RNA 2'-phosphotransferase [Flavobacterium sp. MFBS3-15]MCW4469693.1 RNA 2'-phosphotransferase [Flavobacterium sp. MFBS3-15]